MKSWKPLLNGSEMTVSDMFHMIEDGKQFQIERGRKPYILRESDSERLLKNYRSDFSGLVTTSKDDLLINRETGYKFMLFEMDEYLRENYKEYDVLYDTKTSTSLILEHFIKKSRRNIGLESINSKKIWDSSDFRYVILQSPYIEIEYGRIMVPADNKGTTKEALADTTYVSANNLVSDAELRSISHTKSLNNFWRSKRICIDLISTQHWRQLPIYQTRKAVISI